MDAIGNTPQGATAIRAVAQQPVAQTAQPEADPLSSATSEPSRYYSPVVRIDSETQRAVLQYRDGSDGKVLAQYPSEKQLEAYRNRAIADRAKEQDQADARDAGKPGQQGAVKGAGQTGTGQTGAGQTGIGQQAGSPIAGQSTDGAGSAGGTASGPTTGQSLPIAVAAPMPRASAPVSGSTGSDSAGPAFGTARPVLHSISA